VPSITTHELVDGTYRQIARASGDQPLDVQQPIRLQLTPNELLYD
jgi:hypothetical protein